MRDQYERANEEIEQAKQSEESSESAKRRIEQLQQQLVGGEQAGNEALKQKRRSKIKEAEKKMKRLAGVGYGRESDGGGTKRIEGM